MTRLEELRRRLDAKRASSEGQADMQACAEAYRNADMVLHAALTDDTIAALLDVAEAANEALENAIPAPRYGECIIEHGALGIALAPLVEATDD